MLTHAQIAKAVAFAFVFGAVAEDADEILSHGGKIILRRPDCEEGATPDLLRAPKEKDNLASAGAIPNLYPVPGFEKRVREKQRPLSRDSSQGRPNLSIRLISLISAASIFFDRRSPLATRLT
jgi:hypothetical protein